MKKAATGLAAFANKPIQPETAAPERKRGKGEVVAITLRLNRADWERVHHLAVSEGVSIQQLALTGLSKVFAEKGLPGVPS
jgi:hypothetical protein